MRLSEYKSKRNFKTSPEPRGKVEKPEDKPRFVIQRHQATRLHYDLRLEADGVLKSWALPKGPSLNSSDRRLAVNVEDHPVAYLNFEGTIPEGNYGAGIMDIWDSGTYEPHNEAGDAISGKQFLKDFNKGNIKFRLLGRKLKGSFALVLMKGRGENNWLLIKHKDEFATSRPYSAEDHI